MMKFNKNAILGVALMVAAGSLQAAVAPAAKPAVQSGSLLSKDMSEKVAAVTALIGVVEAALPIMVTDPIKKQEITDMIPYLKFLPALITVADQLQVDVRGVPAESLDIYKKMLLSLQQSQVEFNKAKAATELDGQAQNVLAGLGKLSSGLGAPGEYLTTLNERTFKRVFELLESLPALKALMQVSVVQGGATQQVPLSRLVTNLFTKLSDVTESSAVGVKAANLVLQALIERNNALQEQNSALQARLAAGGAAEGEMSATVMPQEEPATEALDLSDLF